MIHLYRQFAMGAVAVAMMQVASAAVNITNIVPMQIQDKGQKFESCLMDCRPSPRLISLNSLRD